VHYLSIIDFKNVNICIMLHETGLLQTAIGDEKIQFELTNFLHIGLCMHTNAGQRVNFTGSRSGEITVN
jgi:hypothetical protein